MKKKRGHVLSVTFNRRELNVLAGGARGGQEGRGKSSQTDYPAVSGCSSTDRIHRSRARISCLRCCHRAAMRFQSLSRKCTSARARVKRANCGAQRRGRFTKRRALSLSLSLSARRNDYQRGPLSTRLRRDSSSSAADDRRSRGQVSLDNLVIAYPRASCSTHAAAVYKSSNGATVVFTLAPARRVIRLVALRAECARERGSDALLIAVISEIDKYFRVIIRNRRSKSVGAGGKVKGR